MYKRLRMKSLTILRRSVPRTATTLCWKICGLLSSSKPSKQMQLEACTILPLFGLLAHHFLLQGTDASSCPNSWFKSQSRCYGVFSDVQEWTAAEIECQKYGQQGHLVSILSDQEMELLASYIINTYPDVKSLWIGLRDRLKNGRWRWADSSTSMFKAWEGGKPKTVDESGFCTYLSVKQGLTPHLPKQVLCYRKPSTMSSGHSRLVPMMSGFPPTWEVHISQIAQKHWSYEHPKDIMLGLQEHHNCFKFRQWNDAFCSTPKAYICEFSL